MELQIFFFCNRWCQYNATQKTQGRSDHTSCMFQRKRIPQNSPVFIGKPKKPACTIGTEWSVR